MVAIDRESRYAELVCPVCHEQLKPGDRVLTSFKGGKPRAIHAHACTRPRAAALMAVEAREITLTDPAA
jgi:hypothetical protein